MPLSHDLLLIHAAMTLVLCGVMWAIQLTIIPVLARDTEEHWPHHAAIFRRVYYLLFWPLVTIEGGSGVGVALLHPAGIPDWLHRVNLALLACAWITVPLSRYVVGHGPVTMYHPAGFRKYARLNWIRVAVWTARSGVVLAMLHLAAAARAR